MKINPYAPPQQQNESESPRDEGDNPDWVINLIGVVAIAAVILLSWFFGPVFG